MKNMAKEKVITQEEFCKGLETESKRIASWVNKTSSPSDACESFIFYLVCDLNASYYGVLGMLEEVKLRYRELSRKAMEEENE